jgi:hypothetical protein
LLEIYNEYWQKLKESYCGHHRRYCDGSILSTQDIGIFKLKIAVLDTLREIEHYATRNEQLTLIV